MEIPCPRCSQPLRVPDGLRFARVRCRACEHIFETSSVDSPVSDFQTVSHSSALGQRQFDTDGQYGRALATAVDQATSHRGTTPQFDSEKAEPTPAPTPPVPSRSRMRFAT